MTVIAHAQQYKIKAGAVRIGSGKIICKYVRIGGGRGFGINVCTHYMYLSSGHGYMVYEDRVFTLKTFDGDVVGRLEVPC